jgi:hypothetical protein
VIISVVDLILENVNITFSGGGLGVIKAFRTLRLFRVFKLARSWKSLRVLLVAMG